MYSLPAVFGWALCFFFFLSTSLSLLMMLRALPTSYKKEVLIFIFANKFILVSYIFSQMIYIFKKLIMVFALIWLLHHCIFSSAGFCLHCLPLDGPVCTTWSEDYWLFPLQVHNLYYSDYQQFPTKLVISKGYNKTCSLDTCSEKDHQIQMINLIFQW